MAMGSSGYRKCEQYLKDSEYLNGIETEISGKEIKTLNNQP